MPQSIILIEQNIDTISEMLFEQMNDLKEDLSDAIEANADSAVINAINADLSSVSRMFNFFDSAHEHGENIVLTKLTDKQVNLMQK